MSAALLFIEFSDFLVYNKWKLKGGVHMQVNSVISCEQCHRQFEEQHIVKIECDQHIGYVCPMCQHIFTNIHQQERFKEMIRQKTYEQSNPDMKVIHRYLSILITIGVAFCLVIATAMFAVMTPSLPTFEHLVAIVVERFSSFNSIL